MTTTTKRPPTQARRFHLGDWMSAPEWISVKEAAELAGFDIQYVRVLTRQGKVSAQKKGGREWWIDKASLQAYVQQMKSLGNERFNPHRNGD